MTIETESYIRIIEAGKSKSGKTNIWNVLTADRTKMLGIIAWFGQWRMYTFYPEPKTIFESQCLEEISEFTANATRQHYRALDEKHIDYIKEHG